MLQQHYVASLEEMCGNPMHFRIYINEEEVAEINAEKRTYRLAGRLDWLSTDKLDLTEDVRIFMLEEMSIQEFVRNSNLEYANAQAQMQ